ncbi:MAG TPA: hypothetical protein VJP77_06180 [Planctomycetota bacterium]|nr:hypothetical protein [Planctomycetota bacterium]
MDTQTTTPATVGSLGLRLGNARVLVEVRDLADASAIYQRLRDEAGHGASTMPRGRVYRDGKLVAEVSFNGRLWRGKTCVYSPYGVGA